MENNSRKRVFSRGFLFGLGIYILILLLVISCGVVLLSGYLKAYERSLPRNTADSYISALTQEDIIAGTAELIECVDRGIQTEDEALAIIRAATAGEVNCVTNMEKSTDDAINYVLLIDQQKIGSITVTANSDNSFGLPGWEVTDTAFDFSQLLGDAQSITVPEPYTVCANGHLLDESYITQRGIHYDLFEEFYDSCTFPCMVTYTVQNYIGDMELTVFDNSGNDVTGDAATGWSGFVNNCTPEEQEKLTAFMDDFVHRYVQYSGSNESNMIKNFDNLCHLLVKGGALQKRLWAAQVGLQFGQSTSDKVVSVETNNIVHSEDGKYLCSTTYLVDTQGKNGVVQTTNNVKVIIIKVKGRMYVESMVSF